ncbi:MAG: glycosyl hydrolase [Flavobacteriaceae bacterium]|nr:glycosyl hydrolase [Flavobacteriaceae bacterium]
MRYTDFFSIAKQPAVCYSGYREGQYPGGPIPSVAQIKEDLILVAQNWHYIRLYSIDDHTRMVLDVIDSEGLDLKVMLGAYLEAEQNNPNCPWGGGVHEPEVLIQNKAKNLKQVEALIEVAHQYPHIVFSLAVGNEAVVEWTDHLVPVPQLVSYVRLVKKHCTQPVTSCDNYVPWLDQLKPLVNEVDFISIHTYPVWEYKTIAQGMSNTIKDFQAVKDAYPDKLVVITEAGWPTLTNGEGIPVENVDAMTQKIYYNALSLWAAQEEVLVFLFEAFDEPWKGSYDPAEPEKHWGLYDVHRVPKLALEEATYKII